MHTYKPHSGLAVLDGLKSLGAIQPETLPWMFPICSFSSQDPEPSLCGEFFPGCYDC